MKIEIYLLLTADVFLNSFYIIVLEKQIKWYDIIGDSISRDD